MCWAPLCRIVIRIGVLRRIRPAQLTTLTHILDYRVLFSWTEPQPSLEQNWIGCSNSTCGGCRSYCRGLQSSVAAMINAHHCSDISTAQTLRTLSATATSQHWRLHTITTVPNDHGERCWVSRHFKMLFVAELIMGNGLNEAVGTDCEKFGRALWFRQLTVVRLWSALECCQGSLWRHI